MTGRERFLAALNNEKPDRLCCQVHGWQQCYLETTLNLKDQYEAYDYFGMDPVIYVGPTYIFDDSDLNNWQVNYTKSPCVDDRFQWQKTIETPQGILTQKGESDRFTEWTTKYLITDEKDFELWNRYVPLPSRVDWTHVKEAKKRIGENGIVRSGFFDFGQPGIWQSFCTMYGTEKSIIAAIDKPDWVKFVLQSILEKIVVAIERAGRFELDLVETGGGAGSSSVISPAMHREFCLPYDKVHHKAIREMGAKSVYHACGGIMPLLEMLSENGADGLETMTPPAMGGDCDLAEATRRVGDRLFFVGGFDQVKGYQNGSRQIVQQMVRELFAACPNGGYICSPSCHFLVGDPVNIKAFADAVKECYY